MEGVCTLLKVDREPFDARCILPEDEDGQSVRFDHPVAASGRRGVVVGDFIFEWPLSAGDVEPQCGARWKSALGHLFDRRFGRAVWSA